MLKEDFSKELIAWYEENKRDLPWRKTTDPYKIWVSEIMLQQTRVEAVKPYYERFLSAFPTVSSLASADDELLYKLWQGLGYYSRVRNMKKAATVCKKDYGGRLPENCAELKKLCGIGDYTAAAISSFAYGEKVPAIDGNVLRVVSRFLAIEAPIEEGETKKAIFSFLSSVIPEKDAGNFNQALIELGATLCGPDKAARCGGCPLLKECRAYKEGKTELLPIRNKKPERRVEERTLLLLSYTENGEEKFCLVKRSEKGLLAGLWELPALDGRQNENSVCAFLEKKGCRIKSAEPLPHARHIFTHIVWEMDAFRVTLSSPGEFSFHTKEEIKALAVPSAFKAYKKYFS